MDLKKLWDAKRFCMLGLLIGGLSACGGPDKQDNIDVTGHGFVSQALTPTCEIPLVPYKSQSSGSYACCDSRVGERDTTSIRQSAEAEYQHRAGWCTVGRGIAPGCYFGSSVLSQSLLSEVCLSSGPDCANPTTKYYVTCSALVECEYNCRGICVPLHC